MNQLEWQRKVIREEYLEEYAEEGAVDVREIAILRTRNGKRLYNSRKQQGRSAAKAERKKY